MYLFAYKAQAQAPAVRRDAIVPPVAIDAPHRGDLRSRKRARFALAGWLGGGRVTQKLSYVFARSSC